MTLRECENVMTNTSRAMVLVNQARACIALGEPEEAQEALLALSTLLLDLEALAGCYTPLSLFGG